MTERVPLIPKATDPNIDRGWAWMVLFGSSLCHMIFIGTRSAIGVYYVDIQNALNVDIVDVSIIGALSSFSFYCGVVFISPLTDKFGCRMLAVIGSFVACFSHIICIIWMSLYVLYFFLGVFQGLGMALTYSSSIIVINGYFSRARPMGFVFVNLIGSFGQIWCSPLLSFLLQTYSLKGVFLIFAAICLQMTVGAMLYFPQRQRKSTSKSGSLTEGKTVCGMFLVYFDKVLWTDPVHYMATISSFLFGVATFIPLTLLPDYMVKNGISIDIAALSITAIAISSTLSRVILSWTSYKFSWSNRWIYILSGILCGCLLFIVPLCRTGAHYLALLVVFGFPFSAVGCLMPVLLVELFGPSRLPECFGINNLAIGLGSLIGSPLAGAVGCLMPVLLVELFGPSRLPECFGINNLAIGLGSLIGSPLAGYLGETIPVTGIEFIVGGLVYILTGLVMVPIICNNWCNKKQPSSYSNKIVHP